MSRLIGFGLLLASLLVGATGCGSDSNRLRIPRAIVINGGTSSASAQAIPLGNAIPQGAQVVFVGDLVILRGEHFRRAMKVFFGMNNSLARRPNSLLTTPREDLPDTPFVFTDPQTSQSHVLEVEAEFEFITTNEILVRIPAGVACSAAFNNPVLRMFADGGSSDPVVDVYGVVGPRCVALAPKMGLDTGGFTVTIHGDFFSPWTQVVISFIDPADGQRKTFGDLQNGNGRLIDPDNPEAPDDIVEEFIDRHTIVVPMWPAVVPNETFGLTKELKVDVLLFENIDAITGDAALEPLLGGTAPCTPLLPGSEENPINTTGTRNTEKVEAFTFLPTGVTGPPIIQAIVPEFGPEIGGNTVIIDGQQFDAFSVDLNPENPGIRIECPPGSGIFQPPLTATLIDRHTIAVTMPACEIEIPGKVDICLRNKWTIDNPTGPLIDNDGNVAEDPRPGFEPRRDENDPTLICYDDRYEYQPIPPIVPPVLTAVHPLTNDEAGPDGQGFSPDSGCKRVLMVGDWFDGDTTLNGGVEFLLPVPGEDDPFVLQAQRTILHNRNLIEVFVPRLPKDFYPLLEDLTASIRLRNVVGHADFENMIVFRATPDNPEALAYTSTTPATGPVAGGNKIVVRGAGFDTTTEVVFLTETVEVNDEGEPIGVADEVSADVLFVNGNILIVTVPEASEAQTASVELRDGGEVVPAGSYAFDNGAPADGPRAIYLDPNTGSHIGGYTILLRGTNLTPTTEIAFGNGNFSPDVYFVDDTCLRVEVPEAFPEQIGATVEVVATDTRNGDNEALESAPFTYTAAQEAAPEILYVDTTVEVPVTPTINPALNLPGGDRMLVVGAGFDQCTDFSFSKGGETTTLLHGQPGNRVLTPNLAILTAPASPDGTVGEAALKAINKFGESEDFVVEYVAPPPPTILDVRNLDDGTTTAPIDGSDRLLIFGDFFFDDPEGSLVVTLTGPSLADPGETTTETFSTTMAPPNRLTLIEDHIIGINIPADTFTEGDLEITVTTTFGSDSFLDENGDPFQLIGPQPPIVTGVFKSLFNSRGGEEAIFFGRHFTTTTEFEVRTEPDTFKNVINPRFVSPTVYLVTMPEMIGGPFPEGIPGIVKATESDSFLASKITDPDFTESSFDEEEALYFVVNDAAPMLLGVYPDHGSTAGGEQVLLLGKHFLDGDGNPNVDAIRIIDPVLGDFATYTMALDTELPLRSNQSAVPGGPDFGKYVILNDHSILLISQPRPAIEDGNAIANNVEIDGEGVTSTLVGGYTYQDQPADICPIIFGITPNEGRLNGGSSHLISGHFLTDVDEIVLSKGLDSVTIPSTDFTEVNDSFLVFILPDLQGTFVATDVLDVTVVKNDGDGPCEATLKEALTITFAGPPVIEAVGIDPEFGSAWGGTVVEITGDFFTTNSQVLFGTQPARVVIFVNPNKLYAVTPSLPFDALDPGDVGLDLLNVPTKAVLDRTVDVAVFTQGGWAVKADGFRFDPEAPETTAINVTAVPEGSTTRVTITGDRFLDVANTTVTPIITDVAMQTSPASVTVLSVTRHQIVLDFTAPIYDDRAGPINVDFEVATTHGTAPTPVSLDVELNPFFDGPAVTTYTVDSTAATTTGVEGTGLGTVRIRGTLTGANFATTGGQLALQTRTGTVFNLTEVTALSEAPGEFVVNPAGTEVEFTMPFAFQDGVPTISVGNTTMGPVHAAFENPNGLGGEVAGAFNYVPTLIDLEDIAFAVPNTDPEVSAPDNITVADVNADGVNDIIALARQNDPFPSGLNPEAYLFLANTFGTVDVNGDGVTPDFAGNFAQFVIGDDTLCTHREFLGIGSIVRAANLDADPELELVIPVMNRAARGRLMVVDLLNPGFGITVLDPGTASGGISGLDTGRFDDGDAGLDIACITSGLVAGERKVVIFASGAGALSFTANPAEAILNGNDVYHVGFFAAGDFDGDDDDDLIWGQWRNSTTPGSTSPKLNQPVVLATIDSSTGTITAQTDLPDLTGGEVRDIVVGHLGGDDDIEDAVIFFRDEVTGSFVDDERRPDGFAVLLDPLVNLSTHQYVETGYRVRTLPLPFDGDGNALGLADFNANGDLDIATVNDIGEIQIYFGDGEGNFTHSGRTWNLVSIPGIFSSRVHGMDAGDFNGDHMAEVIVGDVGTAPTNIVFWLNTSR